jgi:co-chaperonin GroES (HSP10)
MKNIKPLLTRVYVKVDAKESDLQKGSETVTKSGLVLPKTNSIEQEEYLALTNTNTGTIVAMGSCAFQGFKFPVEHPPKVGDRVIFTKHAGVVPDAEHPNIRIMHDDELIATFEDV